MAGSPAAEIDIDAELVGALLREQAPELAALPLRRAAAGWDNELWRCGDRHVVRLPRRAAAASLVEHELAHLPAIADRVTALRVPRPLLAGRPSATTGMPWTWAVLEWLPGVPGTDVAQADRRTWAEPLAAALTQLHVPSPVPLPANPFRGGSLAQRARLTGAHLDELADRPLAAVLRAAWQAGLDAPVHDGPAVVLHGDPHPGNLLVADGRLSALIDFGDLTAGDPATDLAAAWVTFDAAGRERFRAAMPQHDPATWIRARAWAAALALALLRASDDRPDLMAVGHQTAAQVRADAG